MRKADWSSKRPGRSPGPRTARLLTARERAVVLLIAIYLAVSAIAYTDFPRAHARPNLSDLERRGLHIWRRHNCQACHQIYGFGGFHGPDLTNLVNDARLDEEFSSILERGLGRMPAFNLEQDEQRAVLAYLRRLDDSGQSQPTPLRARRPVDRVEHFRKLTEMWARQSGKKLRSEVREGCETWSRLSCGTCHTPFARGTVRASDLTVRAVDHSVEAIWDVLQQGSGRMPAFVVDHDEVGALASYLEWVCTRRSDLVDLNDRMLEREEFRWSAVPWFEYR